MRPLYRRLWVLLSAALLVGFWSNGFGLDAMAASRPLIGSGPSNVLMDLHIHGSLSEGFGTMANHTDQAEAAGFDGIWWTDHMGRQVRTSHRHAVDFEGNLDGSLWISGIQNRRWFEQDPGGLDDASFSFDAQNATLGNQSLHLNFSSDPQAPWQHGALIYKTWSRSESINLAAEPHVEFDLRMSDYSGTLGNAGFAVRVTLSSAYDNGVKRGRPQEIEFVPEGFLFPATPGIVQVGIPTPRMRQWVHFDCDIKQAVEAFFDPVEDLSLKGVQILFGSKDDSGMGLSIDTFRINHDGLEGEELFIQQRQTLDDHYSNQIFHKVGAEMGGPVLQDVMHYSTRDHILTLLPEDLDEVLEFPAGTQQAVDYPRSGVDWAHDRGGIAIIAHMFGSTHDGITSDSKAQVLVDRLIDEQAFGADGLEVGYLDRGRPLKDFVKAWDALSENGTLITGVGTTDNHNLEDWPAMTNRMATWIQSGSHDGTELVEALRGGKAFFGDPYVFNPQGTMRFEEIGGAFTMGDAVVTPGGSWVLRIEIDGARRGDDLVLIHNGTIVFRYGFQGPQIQKHPTVDAQPGDWIRFEVRNMANEPYLFSNPIYFLPPGQSPPPGRNP